MSYVYLLKAGPYFKIGITNNPDQRIKQLSTLPPFDLELIHLFISSPEEVREAEIKLHDKFAKKRKNGEWFVLNVDDINYIENIDAYEDEEFKFNGVAGNWPIAFFLGGCEYLEYRYGDIVKPRSNPFLPETKAWYEWICGYAHMEEFKQNDR